MLNWSCAYKKIIVSLSLLHMNLQDQIFFTKILKMYSKIIVTQPTYFRDAAHYLMGLFWRPFLGVLIWFFLRFLEILTIWTFNFHCFRLRGKNMNFIGWKRLQEISNIFKNFIMWQNRVINFGFFWIKNASSILNNKKKLVFWYFLFMN